MALIVDIFVNDRAIGVMSAVRVEGRIGGECEYRVRAQTAPHPTTGERIDVDEVRVTHHYNASPIDLVRAMCEAVLQGDSNEHA